MRTHYVLSLPVLLCLAQKPLPALLASFIAMGFLPLVAQVLRNKRHFWETSGGEAGCFV